MYLLTSFWGNCIIKVLKFFSAQVGVVSKSEAIRMADEAELDLVCNFVTISKIINAVMCCIFILCDLYRRLESD